MNATAPHSTPSANTSTCMPTHSRVKGRRIGSPSAGRGGFPRACRGFKFRDHVPAKASNSEITCSPFVLPHTYTRQRAPARSLVHCKHLQYLVPAALTRPHKQVLSLFLLHAPAHNQAAQTHSLLLAQSLSAQSQKRRVSRKCTGALKILRISSRVAAATAQVQTHLSAGAAGRVAQIMQRGARMQAETLYLRTPRSERSVERGGEIVP